MSDQTEDNEPAKIHYEGGVAILDSHRLTEVERKQAESERRDSQYKSDQIRLNKWLVGATVGLVISTILLGGVQACYMHRQWKLTSAGLSKIGDQIWAAKNSADAAKSAAETAATTLTSSITQFRQQVRPYLIEETTRINQKPTVGVVVGIESVVRNTGTTPALNLRVSHTFTFENSLPCRFEKGVFRGDASTVNVGAGLKRAMRVFGERGLTQPEVDAIEHRRMFICYHATFRYDDIFGEKHQTEVCAYYNPPKPENAVGEGDLFLWGCLSHNGIQ